VAQITGNVNFEYETVGGLLDNARELRRSAELAGDPCGPAAAALAEVLETASRLARRVRAAITDVTAGFPAQEAVLSAALDKLIRRSSMLLRGCVSSRRSA
jgi:hypothetical protein